MKHHFLVSTLLLVSVNLTCSDAAAAQTGPASVDALSRASIDALHRSLEASRALWQTHPDTPDFAAVRAAAYAARAAAHDAHVAHVVAKDHQNGTKHAAYHAAVDRAEQLESLAIDLNYSLMHYYALNAIQDLWLHFRAMPASRTAKDWGNFRSALDAIPSIMKTTAADVTDAGEKAAERARAELLADINSK